VVGVNVCGGVNVSGGHSRERQGRRGGDLLQPLVQNVRRSWRANRPESAVVWS
jgi:hypothetical protein